MSPRLSFPAVPGDTLTFSTSIQDLYADVSMSLPYLGFSRVSSSPIVMTSKELGVQMTPREQQTPEALRAFPLGEHWRHEIDRIKLTQVDRAELPARRAGEKQPRRPAAMAAPIVG